MDVTGLQTHSVLIFFWTLYNSIYFIASVELLEADF